MCNDVIFMDGGIVYAILFKNFIKRSDFASWCDLVILGRVMDQGDHITLMSRNEQYCSLIQSLLQETKEETLKEANNSETESSPIEYFPYIY